MSRIGTEKIKLLKDDIISILYENPLNALFTNQIATELRRDNEFTKKILLELKKQGLIEEVEKSRRGKRYCKRKKWRIPTKILKAFEQS